MKCLDSDFLVAILRAKSDAESKMESLEHIYRHSISEQEVENAVNGRILIRSTTRKAEKLKEVIKI